MMKIKNRQSREKISLLCEGKIEKNYFLSYKQQSNFANIILEVKELPRADYKSVKNYLLKNPYLGKPFVILDLDRLKDSNELKAFEELVREIKKQKGFLFLTYPNFESWILAHFEKTNLQAIFSQKSHKDTKEFLAKESNLFEEIQKRGGMLERAIRFYSSLPLYLDRDFSFHQDCISSSQSSLCLLWEMLQEFEGKFS